MCHCKYLSYILTHLRPLCSIILSNFQYKSYFSLITSLPCFVILFFHTLLDFWSQFMTCVALTALISMFLMCLFPEPISLLINYTLFPIFNLLTLPQVPCPNLLLPSTVVSCHLFFVLDSDVVIPSFFFFSYFFCFHVTWATMKK